MMPFFTDWMNHTKKVVGLFVAATAVPFLGFPPDWEDPLMGSFILLGIGLLTYDYFSTDRSSHHQVSADPSPSDTQTRGRSPGTEISASSAVKRRPLSSDEWRRERRDRSTRLPWDTDSGDPSGSN